MAPRTQLEREGLVRIRTLVMRHMVDARTKELVHYQMAKLIQRALVMKIDIHVPVYGRSEPLEYISSAPDSMVALPSESSAQHKVAQGRRRPTAVRPSPNKSYIPIHYCPTVDRSLTDNSR